MILTNKITKVRVTLADGAHFDMDIQHPVEVKIVQGHEKLKKLKGWSAFTKGWDAFRTNGNNAFIIYSGPEGIKKLIDGLDIPIEELINDK